MPSKCTRGTGSHHLCPPTDAVAADHLASTVYPQAGLVSIFVARAGMACFLVRIAGHSGHRGQRGRRDVAVARRIARAGPGRSVRRASARALPGNFELGLER